MPAPIFIGDELTAAGYRLAGLEIRVPGPGEAGAVLEAARAADPPLILLTAERSNEIDPGYLDHALQSARPPLHLVTDAGARVDVPDLPARIRRRIGVSQ